MSILETVRAGWVVNIRDFLNSDRQSWLESLEDHTESSMGETASQSNRTAWLNCHRVLKDQLGQFGVRRPDVLDLIFTHEPLPRIKQAESAGVNDAMAAVAAIIEEARSKSHRHIVFVIGVPGAGKTLTGLQVVYTSKTIVTARLVCSCQGTEAISLR
jgi:hypothetical protein